MYYLDLSTAVSIVDGDEDSQTSRTSTTDRPNGPYGP